ncbi:hypothetical protein [Microbacterium marmarense]|uniref:Uncharacterized protein n=1 Tax=Microbacterium marmarense TaxID=3122051 RepID=A0ABU8LTB7_9MICO
MHAIQGETADASVVGPDVGAAGLDVGLTRWRIHNLAITVARTDDAARVNVAESMLRGTPEHTMQDDAVQAAEAELRRAAREGQWRTRSRRRWWDMGSGSEFRHDQ